MVIDAASLLLKVAPHVLVEVLVALTLEDDTLRLLKE